MSAVLHNIDRLEVVFDDESLVADAGLLTAATLMNRLGLEAVVDSMVRLAGRAGGARPGRKVLTLVASMLLLRDCLTPPNTTRPEKSPERTKPQAKVYVFC